MDIRQKLEPAIEAFIKSLYSVKEDIYVKRDEIDKELFKAEEQSKILKQQEMSHNLTYKAIEDKLKNEIVRYKGLQGELLLEIDKIKLEQRSINKDKREAEQALITAKAERTLAQDKRVSLDIQIKKYKDNTEFLKQDFDLLEKKSNDIARRESIIKSKENLIKETR